MNNRVFLFRTRTKIQKTILIKEKHLFILQFFTIYYQNTSSNYHYL